MSQTRFKTMKLCQSRETSKLGGYQRPSASGNTSGQTVTLRNLVSVLALRLAGKPICTEEHQEIHCLWVVVLPLLMLQAPLCAVTIGQLQTFDDLNHNWIIRAGPGPGTPALVPLALGHRSCRHGCIRLLTAWSSVVLDRRRCCRHCRLPTTTRSVAAALQIFARYPSVQDCRRCVGSNGDREPQLITREQSLVYEEWTRPA